MPHRLTLVRMCVCLVLLCGPLSASPATGGNLTQPPATEAIVYSLKSTISIQNSVTYSKIVQDAPSANDRLAGALSNLVGEFLGSKLSSTIASMSPSMASFAPQISSLYQGIITPAPPVGSSHVEQATATLKYGIENTLTVIIASTGFRIDTLSELRHPNGSLTSVRSSRIYLPSKGLEILLDPQNKTYKQIAYKEYGYPESYLKLWPSGRYGCQLAAVNVDGNTKVVDGLLVHHIVSTLTSSSDSGCNQVGVARDEWYAFVDPTTGVDIGSQSEPFHGLPIRISGLQVQTTSAPAVAQVVNFMSSYNGLTPVDAKVLTVPEGYEPSP